MSLYAFTFSNNDFDSQLTASASSTRSIQLIEWFYRTNNDLACILSYSEYLSSSEVKEIIKHTAIQYAMFDTKGIHTEVMVTGASSRCKNIWTGGRSFAPSTNVNTSEWHWYYNNDPTGPSEPFTFLAYGKDKQSKAQSHDSIVLSRWLDYDFNFFSSRPQWTCFLCECAWKWRKTWCGLQSLCLYSKYNKII